MNEQNERFKRNANCLRCEIRELGVGYLALNSMRASTVVASTRKIKTTAVSIVECAQTGNLRFCVTYEAVRRFLC